MEGSQPQLPPSEAELGDFLEDILFSPEGGGLNPNLLLDEFNNPNPLDPATIAVSNNAAVDEFPIDVVNNNEAASMSVSDVNAAAPRRSQPPTQMTSNPVSKGKSAEVLQALAKSAAEQKPAAQEPVKPAKDSAQAASKKPSTRVVDDKSLVLPGEVRPKDILCIRGTVDNAATNMFRKLITSSKAHFDTLATADEKEQFASDLWAGLREKEHR